MPGGELEALRQHLDRRAQFAAIGQGTSGHDAPFGDQIRFSGRVEQTEFLGDSMRYSIEIAGKTVWMDRSRSSETLLNVGDQVVVGLDPARIRILEG